MLASKADIIARLQKDILPLQGFKPVSGSTVADTGLGPIRHAFPNNEFPTGAVHEFICNDKENAAATTGFIAGILSSLMKKEGVAVWISSSMIIFPPALAHFGLEPHNIFFINLQKEKDILWVIEESLKCNGVAAVIGEIQDISFTAGRRLQLAVEQSQVTGFLLHHNHRQVNTGTCIARWKVSAAASGSFENLPGVGFPRWKVELLKVRNGKPGNWEVEWANGNFRHVYKTDSVAPAEQRKTG